MTLYSYIVRWDGGFAPNPFFGYCTLACCKPGIRRKAKKEDWIVGLTPRAKGEGNKIVYFMEVEEVLTFDVYWKRFKQKRPKLDDGFARRNGDNIYEPQPGGGYRQRPSAHSKPQFGTHEDPERKEDDLKGENVLVSTNFVYFGSEAVDLPPELEFLVVARNYRSHFSGDEQEAFLHFIRKVCKKKIGVVGRPGLWRKDDGSWKGAACGKR
jgi:hypothetical protein